MSSSRDLQFDGLKFLLVFLVVLGHLTFKDYGIGVKRMIFSFHMPVFVFLSGYFTSLSSDKERHMAWIKRTFIIFIVAHISQCLLKILVGYAFSRINGSSFSFSSELKWDALICPGYALWYLVCLLYWRIAIWMISEKMNDIHLFIASCVTVIIAGFIPLDHEFSFQRAFAFSPFFMLGIVFKRRNLIKELERIPFLCAVLGLVVGLLFSRELPTYLPVYHYVTWKKLVLRLVQTSLGLFLCLMVIRVSRCKFTEYFAKYGSKTLWIYIGHTYLIILGRRLFPYWGVSFNLFTAILLAILYCSFFIILARLHDRLKERNLF